MYVYSTYCTVCAVQYTVHTHMYTHVCDQDCVHCVMSPKTQEDVLSEVAKSEADVISYLDQINRYRGPTSALLCPQP